MCVDDELHQQWQTHQCCCPWLTLMSIRPEWLGLDHVAAAAAVTGWATLVARNDTQPYTHSLTHSHAHIASKLWTYRQLPAPQSLATQWTHTADQKIDCSAEHTTRTETYDSFLYQSNTKCEQSNSMLVGRQRNFANLLLIQKLLVSKTLQLCYWTTSIEPMNSKTWGCRRDCAVFAYDT